MAFERAKIALPVQPKAQRGIKHGGSVEIRRGDGARFPLAGLCAVRRRVMARIAAECVIMREARVVEQAVPERCLPRVLNRRRRNWSDRLRPSPH